jgi:hypothetical protein
MVEFAEENEILAVYIPATKSFIPFRVKSIANKGFEEINYGALPIKSGTTLYTYDGTTTTVPADGVLPARAYTLSGILFPPTSDITTLFDTTDMWYTNEDYATRLFHVVLRTTPAFLRTDVQVPVGVIQRFFQKANASVGVDKTFGFKRGEVETVIFPKIHYGWRFGNDTNMSVYTFAKFIYREYEVEIVKDPDTIFNISVYRFPAKWKTAPIMAWDYSIKQAFETVYGFSGYPIHTVYERDQAIAEYRNLAMGVKI